jgi:hypothetical protein
MQRATSRLRARGVGATQRVAAFSERALPRLFARGRESPLATCCASQGAPSRGRRPQPRPARVLPPTAPPPTALGFLLSLLLRRPRTLAAEDGDRSRIRNGNSASRAPALPRALSPRSPPALHPFQPPVASPPAPRTSGAGLLGVVVWGGGTGWPRRLTLRLGERALPRP